MVHLALEGNDIVHRIPEINPFETGKFRLVGQTKVKSRVLTREVKQEPNLFLADAQGLGIMPLISTGQAITQPAGCGTYKFHLVRRQTGFLFQLPIHSLDGSLIATHPTLWELPSVTTASLCPEDSAVPVHQDDSDVGSVTVWINHSCYLPALIGTCDTSTPLISEC